MGSRIPGATDEPRGSAEAYVKWVLLTLAVLVIGAVALVAMGWLGAFNDTRRDGGDG